MNQATDPLTEETGPGPSRRGSRRMKLLAVSLPFLLLLVLELVFRVAGLFPDTSTRLNPVGFAAGTRFFSQWDEEIEQPKPEDTLRIFTLGGSCTYGFRVQRSFSDLMVESLGEDGRRVEVINGGYPAFGSHRVLAIARRAAEFSPDWFLVYMGHNEFLENVFYDPEGLVARMEQAGELARSLRVINGTRALLGEPVNVVRSQLPAEFFGNNNYPLIKSEAEVSLRMALLREHVMRIVEVGRQAGACVVVVPAVPNLLSPPGDSVHGPRADVGSGQWSQLDHDADRQFKGRDWQGLGETAETMIALDEHYALAHFWNGLSLLGRGRIEEGRAALVEANRRDRRGTRANPAVIETIRRATADAGGILVSVDAVFHGPLEAEFQRMAAGGVRELFVDHCHPTVQGHALIAAALVEVVTSDKAGRSSTGSPGTSPGPDVPRR